jgi:hypothetical protein
MSEASMSQMNVSNSRCARLSFGRVLALSLGVVSAATACGGETDTAIRDQFLPGNLAQLGIAGAAAGGAGGADGASGGSGGGAAGTAAAPPPPVVVDPEAASGTPQECNGPEVANGIFGTPAPATGMLIDFSTYVEAGTWGDSGLGQITGGTSVYSVRADADLTRETVDGQLHLTASMTTNGDYTGIVLWFGPCVNATAFAGLTFPVTGSLGGARMQVKAQTSPDYPVDVTNTKGKCTYPREADKFTTCQQPVVNIDALEMNPLVLPWEMFTGGVPEVAVDPAQLLGFELQFQCQAPEGACEVDVTIGTVNFIPAG